jgi:hypothetical protein
MKKLSIGLDSTLENWIMLSEMYFGTFSEATKFLTEKAEKEGLQAEVLADEGQLIIVLKDLHLKWAKKVMGDIKKREENKNGKENNG